MSKETKKFGGDGPLLRFSQELEALLTTLPEVLSGGMDDMRDLESRLPERGRDSFVDVARDRITDPVFIGRAYVAARVQGLIEDVLFPPQGNVRWERKCFRQPENVRALQFAFGSIGTEEANPDLSGLVKAQVLHGFSYPGNGQEDSPAFSCQVIHMPNTTCTFREAVPMARSDSVSVQFRSGSDYPRTVHDSHLLGIAKGRGKVRFAQRLTLPEFIKTLETVVGRQLAAL